MAARIRTNGRAIYGTRPWTTFGEGPTRVVAGNQNEGEARPFTAEDVRFTTRGDTLYALLLGWPAGGRATITSLAGDGPFRGRVRNVTLLGGPTSLSFAQARQGLVVTLPVEPPPGEVRVYALEISGRGLVAG